MGCGHPAATGTEPHIFTTLFKTTDVKMNDFQLATGPGVNVNICRDSNGLFAQEADCSHAQCLLELASDNAAMPQWQCNCHGSKFDYNGNVINPPAPRALTHYSLTVNPDGSMTFDLAKTVDPSTRAQG